jgi:hypothetical protein
MDGVEYAPRLEPLGDLVERLRRKVRKRKQVPLFGVGVWSANTMQQ